MYLAAVHLFHAALSSVGAVCVYIFLHGIILLVRYRPSQFTAAVILLTCVLCPIIDSFDTWDDALQTGNETEYTFVIVALSVGLSYFFVAAAFRSLTIRLYTQMSFPDFCFAGPRFLNRTRMGLLLDDAGPPLLALRI